MIMGVRRYDVCMELLLIALAAAAASAATLISGFGLSTALVPVFALYFPLPLAIGAVAVVHLLNSLFKVGIMRTTELDSRNTRKLKGQDPERPSNLAFESTKDPNVPHRP